MRGKRISILFKAARTLFIALIMLAGVCACGGRADSLSSEERLAGRHYSVSRRKIAPEPYYFSALLPDENFYCLNGKASEDSDVQTLTKYPLTQNGTEYSILTLSVPQGQSANLFAQDDDGNILLLAEESSAQNFFLRKYTSAGELLFDRDITPCITDADDGATVQTMLADADGIYLAVGSAVVALNADGTFCARIATKAGRVNALFEQDDRIYAVYDNHLQAATAAKLAQLDIAGKKLLPRKNFPDLKPNLFCIARGEVLLENVWLTDLYDIQETEDHFQEAINFIGCPNAYGEKCSICSISSGSYAISAKSQNKEGAWEFMEFLFSIEADYGTNFPSRKSEFERSVKQVCTGYRLDENGDPILNADGEPYPYITDSTTSRTSNGETWSYTSHTPTQEEIDLLRELINTARRSDAMDDQILNIILEECGALSSGDKSVEDTAAVIQSRVRLYLQEKQ